MYDGIGSSSKTFSEKIQLQTILQCLILVQFQFKVLLMFNQNHCSNYHHCTHPANFCAFADLKWQNISNEQVGKMMKSHSKITGFWTSVRLFYWLRLQHRFGLGLFLWLNHTWNSIKSMKKIENNYECANIPFFAKSFELAFFTTFGSTGGCHISGFAIGSQNQNKICF